jgi:cytochrome c oxidase cbb3-type subunit IV
MSYEEVRVISGMLGLFIFAAAFVLVLVYTFWPKNRKRFDDASRMALDKDPDDNSLRGKYGR